MHKTREKMGVVGESSGSRTGGILHQSFIQT